MWPFGRKRVKPLLVSQEDGFIDLEFGIVDAGEHEGLTTFAALARHDSQTVGLNVDVRGIGPPRELSPGLIVTPTLVTLRSTGDVSDRLLQLLARLFGSNQKPNKMIEHLVLDAVSLDGDPTQVLNEHVQIKLFHDLELARRREGGPPPRSTTRATLNGISISIPMPGPWNS